MSVSSVDGRLLTGFSIVLKQPALFLIEAWLLSNLEKIIHGYFLNLVVLIAAAAAILLQPNHLFFMYNYLSGAVLMLVMHFYTHDFIKESNNTGVDNTEAILRLIILGLAGQLVIYLFEERSWKRYTLMAYSVPIIAAFLHMDHTNTMYLFHLTDGLVSSYLIYLAVNMLIIGVDKLKKQVTRLNHLVRVFGFLPVLKSIVGSVHITQQLLLFCFVSFTYKVYHFSTQTSDSHLVSVSQLDLISFLFMIVGQCCNTYLGLASICVVTSYLSHYLFCLVNHYLFGWKSPVPTSEFPSQVMGVAVFVLSVATGIPMSSNTLGDVMAKCFLVKYVFMYSTTDLIHFTYELVDPEILALSAIPTLRPFKHIRGITMYISFMMLIIFTMMNIQQYDNVFIFIPLIITGLSTCLQVMASIVIYSLFVYDGICLNPVENLDDIVCYIRSTVQFLEFVGSVILAGRGIWIIKTGAFNWIGIPFFILFCYTNVWQRLHDGWKRFLLQKDAVQKMNALRSATKDQIRDYDDVCSICIRQMSSAKITPCGHLFHETCLRKWINVRDSCPLCLRKL